MLVEYVRDKNRNRVGVVVAVKGNCDSQYLIGWSAKHSQLDAHKKFNRELALEIATGRAMTNSQAQPPSFVLDTFDHVNERARRYFKS